MKISRIVCTLLHISYSSRIRMFQTLLPKRELLKYYRYFDYKIGPTEYFLKGLAMRNFRLRIQTKEIEKIVIDARSYGKVKKYLGNRKIKL